MKSGWEEGPQLKAPWGWVIISKSCLVCCILNVRVDKVKKISDFLILLWFLYNRFIYQVEMKRNIDLIGTFSFFGTTRNRCERGAPVSLLALLFAFVFVFVVFVEQISLFDTPSWGEEGKLEPFVSTVSLNSAASLPLSVSAGKYPKQNASNNSQLKGFSS